MFLHHLVRWPSADIQVKFYGDRPRGTPPSGELNTRWVAEYSDFGPIERYISETVQDISLYIYIDYSGLRITDLVSGQAAWDGQLNNAGHFTVVW